MIILLSLSRIFRIVLLCCIINKIHRYYIFMHITLYNIIIIVVITIDIAAAAAARMCDYAFFFPTHIMILFTYADGYSSYSNIVLCYIV